MITKYTVMCDGKNCKEVLNIEVPWNITKKEKRNEGDFFDKLSEVGHKTINKMQDLFLKEGWSGGGDTVCLCPSCCKKCMKIRQRKFEAYVRHLTKENGKHLSSRDLYLNKEKFC